MLHGIYEQVHQLVAKGKMGKARDLFDHLIEVSRDLLNQIELLEKEVEAWPERH